MNTAFYDGKKDYHKKSCIHFIPVSYQNDETTSENMQKIEVRTRKPGPSTKNTACFMIDLNRNRYFLTNM